MTDLGIKHTPIEQVLFVEDEVKETYDALEETLIDKIKQKIGEILELHEKFDKCSVEIIVDHKMILKLKV